MIRQTEASNFEDGGVHTWRMLQIVEWSGFDRSNSVFIADHGRFKSVKISTRERGNTTRVRHEFRFIGHCIFAAGSESILSIKTRFKPGFLVPPPPPPTPPLFIQ